MIDRWEMARLLQLLSPDRLIEMITGSTSDARRADVMIDELDREIEVWTAEIIRMDAEIREMAKRRDGGMPDAIRKRTALTKWVRQLTKERDGLMEASR